MLFLVILLWQDLMIPISLYDPLQNPNIVRFEYNGL
jgi:hypothetical protein